MSAQMIQMIGTALLHFFWQGAALAVLLLMAISFTRNARVRYVLGVCTLALMALCPLVTPVFIATPSVVSGVTVNYPSVAPAVSNISVVLDNAAPVTSFDLLTSLVWIWCGGVCLFGARAFGGWLMLQRLRRTAQEAISPALLGRCRRLQQRIGIHAVVRYAYSEIVDAPAVVGWFRPLVLIPLAAMSGLSAEQLEAIIAHELAHVRRYDALVNLFQIAVETVLFYHPAVWWVNRVIRTERENCCDDIAVAVCGNAGEYARALAMMGGGSAPRPSWAMAANGGALKARVLRLLGMQKIAHGIPRAGLAVLAVMCASCVVVAAGVFKQDAPTPPPVPPPPPAAPADPPPPPALFPPESDALMIGQKAQRENEQILLRKLESELAAARKASQAELSAPQLKQLQDLQQLLRQREQLTSQFDQQEAAAWAQATLAPLAEPSADRDDQATEPAPRPEIQEHSGPSYIDSLASAGLTKLSVDDLIALKIQGVTADYVRQIKAAGFDVGVRELISLRIQGVTPEYIRDIRATGLKPNSHELIGMKVQGVTPEFVRALQSAGLGDLQMRDFMSAKIQGITPEFIEKVRSHGFKDLTFRQLMSLKMANVF